MIILITFQIGQCFQCRTPLEMIIEDEGDHGGTALVDAEKNTDPLIPWV
jgi:hypothetical protein